MFGARYQGIHNEQIIIKIIIEGLRKKLFWLIHMPKCTQEILLAIYSLEQNAT